MDREAVVRELRAWADGVDAATGVALPPDHPAQHPHTLRVVFAALALLESSSPSAMRAAAPNANASTSGPPNAGRPWSNDEDDALASAFDAGETIGALAARLGRTRGAINARLVKLGKIEMPQGLRLRGEPGASRAAS